MTRPAWAEEIGGNMTKHSRFGSIADRDAVEQQMPYEARDNARTIYEFLSRTAERVPDRPAVSFQLLSGPNDHATTLSWRDLLARVTETANLLRAAGFEL